VEIALSIVATAQRDLSSRAAYGNIGVVVCVVVALCV